ncbi:MAG: hypothetical protein AMXMBFR84_28000 [Candidatus Hydrogenedentota bacterium]
MIRYIAFLRAINVGGHTVTMDRLRTLFEELGHSKVETFIASGNVIFESRSKNTAALAKAIEVHLKAALGYEVSTFLRTDAEIAAIATYEPASKKILASATAFVVGFLAEPLSLESTKAILALKTDSDYFHVHGTEIYWVCKTKQSDSTFSNAAFERITKTKATFRGMNTVRRLAAKYGKQTV